MEVRIRLQPKQREFRAAIEKYPVTLFGGARGGGKSFALRNILLARRFQYPGSSGAIFRKTYPELEANHIRPLFNEHPGLRDYWNESKKLLSLPNGSTLQFSHCASQKDVDLYQGREIQDLAIDECGQWTEQMFRTIMGSNRSSKAGVPARAALTANPGNIGHQWLKRIFVQKNYNERERAGDYHFIQSLVNDNPALLEADPDYVHRLNAEPNEAIRRAYLFGDWDIQAGAFFTELRREIHLIKPVKIEPHWIKFGAYDFGFNHPAAFGWYACDEDGNVYKYREYAKPKRRVDEQARDFLEFKDTKQLEYIVAGHDCWRDTGVSTKGAPPTIAEEFMNQGINLMRANIGRIQGATQVRNYLAWQGKEPQRPRFFIFDTCPITYDCLSRMQHDPDRLEDVLKVDAGEGDPLTGDDSYDETRMALMSRPPVAVAIERGPKPGTSEWLQKEQDEMEKAARNSAFGNEGITFVDDPWAKQPAQFNED